MPADRDLFGWTIPKLKPTVKKHVSGWEVTWKKSGRIVKVIYKLDEKQLALGMADRNHGTIRPVFEEDEIEIRSDGKQKAD